MNRLTFRAIGAIGLLGALTLSQVASAKDKRAEAAAQAALKKAAADYRTKHYAAAATRLQKAADACGADKCSAATRAAVMRDLGTMQFRQGDTDAASKSFAEALSADPSVKLNRRYATADLQSAWDAAKASASPTGESNSNATSNEEPAPSNTTPAPETAPPESTPAPEASTPAPVEAPEGEGEKSKGEDYEHLWVGVAGTVDFFLMPAGNDLCKLNAFAVPVNSLNAYCTYPDGPDFPTHLDNAANNALVPGQSGNTASGIHPGDIRALVAIDYALSPAFLLGVRAGYIFNAYPGYYAQHQGRAYQYDIHAELRATYLFGSAPLANVGFAPMVFAGAGLSEFDGHVPADVSLMGVVGAQRVNVWITDGPWFATIGGGVRYQFSLRTAFTAALRVNVAFPWNGVMPTVGPEVGFQYGF